MSDYVYKEGYTSNHLRSASTYTMDHSQHHRQDSTECKASKLSLINYIPPSPRSQHKIYGNREVKLVSRTVPGTRQHDGSFVYQIDDMKSPENGHTPPPLPYKQQIGRQHSHPSISMNNSERPSAGSNQLQFYVGLNSVRSSDPGLRITSDARGSKANYVNDGRRTYAHYQQMRDCPSAIYNASRITSHLDNEAKRTAVTTLTSPNTGNERSHQLTRSRSDSFTPVSQLAINSSDRLRKQNTSHIHTLTHSDSDEFSLSDSSLPTSFSGYQLTLGLTMEPKPVDGLQKIEDIVKPDAETSKQRKPELYPECSHKLDILEQSLELLGLNIEAMTELAVTTPPCTKIDTEFCICHQKFDSNSTVHGIWKYFCDGEKCYFCCQVFEQLAKRPARLNQLSVLDLNLELLKSKAVSVVGPVIGSLVVYIETQNPLWTNCNEDCLLDLANILEYILSSLRNGKLRIVIDCRQSSEALVNIIMKSIYSAPSVVDGVEEVTFVVDRVAQARSRLVKPSTALDIKVKFCSQEEYSADVDLDRLPIPLGGKYAYQPESWIRSQAGLERLLQHYQRALDGILQTTHNLSLVPRTIRHAAKVIPQHDKALRFLDKAVKLVGLDSLYNHRNLLDDSQIQQILLDLKTFMNGSTLLSQLMDSLQSIGQMTRQVSRLKSLAQDRLRKLFKCQKLWNCIEEITKTLTLLRKAQDLINRHRILSSNLKSAQAQYNNFMKIKPSIVARIEYLECGCSSLISYIEKLLSQGHDLLTECISLQREINPKIQWLEDLSNRLEQELDFLSALLGKTELLITDTFYCYSMLDQAYDWAVESMKFVSSMNMEQCVTEEGVEKLRKSLMTFMREHKIIDNSIFDDVTQKALNLDNKKLIEQCRVAKSRCEETRRVIKVRESTIRKAREEIEAQRAKRISLAELAANTNISPLTNQPADAAPRPTIDEEIWIPQKLAVESQSPRLTSRHSDDDANNNTPSSTYDSSIKQTSKPDLEVGEKAADQGSNRSSLADSESCDTITSSQDELMGDFHDDKVLGDKSGKVTPILSDHQRETSLVKRRSFAGFTSPNSLSIPNSQSASKKLRDNVIETAADTDVEDELHMLDETSRNHSSSLIEQIEKIGLCHTEPTIKANRPQSLLESVAESTNSKEAQTEVTDDSGILSKSTSSFNSNEKEAGVYGEEIQSPVPVNSHLINKRVITASQWQSMSDLRLTEAEIQSRRTLAHIMDELVQTERDYVMSLRLIVDQYIPEIEREDVPQSLRGKRSIVFGNIEKIYEFHNHCFLKELEECENQPFKISQCFLDHEREFMMYALYNKNKPKSDELMSDHGTNFFQGLQTKLGDKMNLSSYLLKPVQRMAKYNLIIKQILKECPESAAEYHDLTTAQEMIRFCLQHGNDLLAMDALKECDVNLQEQGMLLLQDEFTVQKGRHKATKRHLFLFEDLLVFAKPKKIIAGQDEYLYKFSLKTVDLGLTENVGSSGLKFEIWFRKRSQDTWVLQASSPQVKNTWVQKLEKILWNQAIKNRESRLTELSSMGIGTKPSLDLKQSEDNITSRQVYTDMNHKVVRMKSLPEFGGCKELSSPCSIRSDSTSSKDDTMSATCSETSSRKLTDNMKSQGELSGLLPGSSRREKTGLPNESSLNNIKLDTDWVTQVRRSDSGVSSMSTNSLVSGVISARNEDQATAVLSLCEQPLTSSESNV